MEEAKSYKKLLNKVEEGIYEYTKDGKTVKVFLTDKLLEQLDEEAVRQMINVLELPGVYSPVCAMSDMHRGYGFAIGGVAAIDFENGCISPGGVGFDINCGVRMLTTPLKKQDVEPKIKELLESLFKHVPSGVGSESKIRLNPEELDKVLKTGSKWALENNYAFEEDLEHTESNGCMEEADANTVSPKAKKRGKNQLGTLGAGNHFLEIQVVDEIYDEETAKAFGITEKGQITVMIHCGSRGLGHQVCSDYIRKMEEGAPGMADSLPDRDLIYAKAGTQAAKDYFAAMCAAANYAWCNRQVIAHYVRQAFKETLGTSPKDMKQIYDVAHNIAKVEEYEIDGEKRKVYLHRKGATRAFPAGHPEVPAVYKDYGQPVLIPGSMGTASYILVGTEKGMQQSYGSSAHGAGRTMSRHEAHQHFKGDQVQKELEQRNIYVKAASWKGICEEAPGVYKQIDEVIDGVDKAGIAKKIVRVVPFGVIKG